MHLLIQKLLFKVYCVPSVFKFCGYSNEHKVPIMKLAFLWEETMNK